MLRISIVHGVPIWVSWIRLIAFVVDEFRSSVKSLKSFKISQLVAGLEDLSEQESECWYPFPQLDVRRPSLCNSAL